MYQILIIDDDIDLCKLLKNNLEKEGYSVHFCNNGCIGLTEIQNNTYQLIILDIMLPLKNGYEVLTEIRTSSHVPILMLTAKDEEGDKVSCLRIGADDYLTKPFSNSELLARVSALLRRYIQFTPKNKTNNEIILGKLSINPSRHEVYKNAQKIELTAKEFDLLMFLAKNQGQVFTKKQIYNAVWNDEYTYDDNNIMVHIRRLRKKIEDDPENPIHIITVWGVGYKAGDFQ
ncbi:MAG: response regulator transcription factor [Lachnospiraceae bacterium]|nr:response regulator transcription factor [Lachnospiraceae bacterium]